MNKQEHFEKAYKWVKTQPFKSLRAKIDGYEDPKIFTAQTSNESVQADFSFITRRGAKHFSDIVLKDADPTQLVTRWKLLSTMAELKDGKLHLLAPKGHKSFAQRLVKEHNINASVHSI